MVELSIHYTVVGFLESHRHICDGKLITTRTDDNCVTVCPKCASVYQYRKDGDKYMEYGIVAPSKQFTSDCYPEPEQMEVSAC